MSEPVQKFLLKNLRPVKVLINDRLANRPGFIGGIFKRLKIGTREYGQHTIPKIMKLMNSVFMMQYTVVANQRQVFSRFFGHIYGPLNYTGIVTWCFLTGAVIFRFPIYGMRDILQFNEDDGIEKWFLATKMLFPPNALNNRTSAHYIEINHIYMVEMFKRYRKVRQEVL